jgi:hypothetical protein
MRVYRCPVHLQFTCPDCGRVHAGRVVATHPEMVGLTLYLGDEDEADSN